MNCKEVVLQFLMEYLSRELPSELEAEFELHLAQCPSCVNYLQSYKDTVTLGHKAREEEEEPPEELVLAVLALQRS